MPLIPPSTYALSLQFYDTLLLQPITSQLAIQSYSCLVLFLAQFCSCSNSLLILLSLISLSFLVIFARPSHCAGDGLG